VRLREFVVNICVKGKKDTKSIVQTPKLKKLITKEKNPKRQVRLQKKDQKRKVLEDSSDFYFTISMISTYTLIT
jgi:hypothetical protein